MVPMGFVSYPSLSIIFVLMMGRDEADWSWTLGITLEIRFMISASNIMGHCSYLYLYLYLYMHLHPFEFDCCDKLYLAPFVWCHYLELFKRWCAFSVQFISLIFASSTITVSLALLEKGEQVVVSNDIFLRMSKVQKAQDGAKEIVILSLWEASCRNVPLIPASLW